MRGTGYLPGSRHWRFGGNVEHGWDHWSRHLVGLGKIGSDDGGDCIGGSSHFEGEPVRIVSINQSQFSEGVAYLWLTAKVVMMMGIEVVRAVILILMPYVGVTMSIPSIVPWSWAVGGWSKRPGLLMVSRTVLASVEWWAGLTSDSHRGCLTGLDLASALTPGIITQEGCYCLLPRAGFPLQVFTRFAVFGMWLKNKDLKRFAWTICITICFERFCTQWNPSSFSSWIPEVRPLRFDLVTRTHLIWYPKEEERGGLFCVGRRNGTDVLRNVWGMIPRKVGEMRKKRWKEKGQTEGTGLLFRTWSNLLFLFGNTGPVEIESGWALDDIGKVGSCRCLFDRIDPWT